MLGIDFTAGHPSRMVNFQETSKHCNEKADGPVDFGGIFKKLRLETWFSLRTYGLQA